MFLSNQTFHCMLHYCIESRMTFHFYVVFEIVKLIYTSACTMKTVVLRPLISHQQPPLESYLTAHRCVQWETEVASHKHTAAKNTKPVHFQRPTSPSLPPDLRQLTSLAMTIVTLQAQLVEKSSYPFHAYANVPHRTALYYYMTRPPPAEKIYKEAGLRI